MGLRIGMVTGEFPPMEGGVGAFTNELAETMALLGHELHIITDKRARPQEAPRDFWNPRDPLDQTTVQIHPRVNRWWWSATHAVADVAIRFDLDVVNLQYQAAAFDMHVPAVNFLPWRLRGVAPIVVTFHDLRHPYLFPKAGRARNWVVGHLARSADGVVATNSADHQQLLELGLDPNRLRQIPIGSNVSAVEPEVIQVTAIRQDLGLDREECLLGYFGFVNESKGADTLLKALAGLKQGFRLVFIGGKTGSSDPTNQAYLSQIERLIFDLDLSERVSWSGFLAEDALSAYMEACDIMVMPYRDGVSLRRGTLMAILAHGRPLVTTQAKSQPAPLVHGKNVWLSAVDDPSGLKDAIQVLAADLPLRNRLAQGALEVAQTFTWDKIAAETLEFYEYILDHQVDRARKE